MVRGTLWCSAGVVLCRATNWDGDCGCDCGLRIAAARAGARQIEEASQGFEVVRAVVLIEMMTKEDSASELLCAVCRLSVQEYRS